MKLCKILTFCIILLLLCGSCKKFLDQKPDESFYIPKNLGDCQALLDDYSKMNGGFPSDGELASDNYYLTEASWSGLSSNDDRNNYIWLGQADHATSSWSRPYAAIFNSNLVLQVLKEIKPNTGIEYDKIKGAALFFRGYSLYSIASLFCKPFNIESAKNDLGVPVRLSPDINIVYGRGTAQQTYDQIINDLKEASDLLPETSTIKSRPNKVAAYAALARVYLSMKDYINAGIYSNLCLKLNHTLLNYYSLNPSATIPFQRFNDEVIFSSTLISLTPLSQTNAKIIKEKLFDLYDANDLRKDLFFRLNTGINAGTYGFKGSYDGSSAGLFGGLATDEIYLIRAECFARAGKAKEALKDLNDLLKTRWQVNKDNNGTIISSKYIDYDTSSPEDALDVILNERKKELLFRGIRWTDLRRLNFETRTATTLTRTINGKQYFLPPNDLRYTLLIPKEVINTTKVPQNLR